MALLSKIKDLDFDRFVKEDLKPLFTMLVDHCDRLETEVDELRFCCEVIQTEIRTLNEEKKQPETISPATARRTRKPLHRLGSYSSSENIHYQPASAFIVDLLPTSAQNTWAITLTARGTIDASTVVSEHW